MATARTRLPLLLTTSIALLPLVAATAWAGGAGLYEIGTPDLGTAAAGRAATADDASIAFANPAGMTRLQGFQILGGLQIFQVQVFFDPERPPSNVSGGAGGNAGGFSPLPSWGGWAPGSGFYGVYSLQDDLKLGFSINTYAGGSVDYDNNWTGRYYAQRADLLTLNFNPAIAYRVMPWLSVGAGFSIQYAKLVQKVAIDNILDHTGDGRITVRDATVGFGGNAGVLLEPTDSTRFGLAYRSPVDLGFNNIASVSNLGPTLKALLTARGVLGRPVDMSLTIPQEIMLSAFHELTPALAVMSNFGWQNWSAFGKPELMVSGKSLTVNQNYKDTFHTAIGTRVRLDDPLLLSTGFAYDTSAVPDATRSPALPIDEQFRFALGLQYDWSEAVTLGIAYEFLYLDNAPINRSTLLGGTLTGDYSTNHVNFVNFTLITRF